MKQQYINKIREACIKANPKIMELKFGCEVIRGSDFGGSPENVFIGNPYECIQVIGKSNKQVRNPWNIDDTDDLLKILGRPIQLADVLLAIEFRNGQTRGTKDFDMWVFQKEFTFEDKDGFQYSWDLTKPLEDQEEETLKFIAGIV